MSTPRYRKEYMLTHDIDWFCMMDGIPVHCASNGTPLPDEVNYRLQNRRLQELVAAMPYVLDGEELEYNIPYIQRRLEVSVITDGRSELSFESYVASFRDMARKGFVSFDCTVDGERYIYEWVVRPKRMVEFYLEGIPQINDYFFPYCFFRSGCFYFFFYP